MEWRKVERMTLGPSRCFFCQRSDGPAVDAGIQRPLPVGRVYICAGCVNDITRVLGGLTPEEAASVRKELGLLRRTNGELGAEIAELRRLERAVAQARDTALA